MKSPLDLGIWLAFDEVESTQAVAADHLLRGEPVGVIFALRQTAGRGRFGRRLGRVRLDLGRRFGRCLGRSGPRRLDLFLRQQDPAGRQQGDRSRRAEENRSHRRSLSCARLIER